MNEITSGFVPPPEGEHLYKSSQKVKKTRDFIRHYVAVKGGEVPLSFEQDLKASDSKLFNHLESLEKHFLIPEDKKTENEGSLPNRVKAGEAQELLPGQTTSDSTILQPNSPGRIESQHADTIYHSGALTETIRTSTQEGTSDTTREVGTTEINSYIKSLVQEELKEYSESSHHNDVLQERLRYKVSKELIENVMGTAKQSMENDPQALADKKACTSAFREVFTALSVNEQEAFLNAVQFIEEENSNIKHIRKEKVDNGKKYYTHHLRLINAFKKTDKGKGKESDKLQEVSGDSPKKYDFSKLEDIHRLVQDYIEHKDKRYRGLPKGVGKSITLKEYKQISQALPAHEAILVFQGVKNSLGEIQDPKVARDSFLTLLRNKLYMNKEYSERTIETPTWTAENAKQAARDFIEWRRNGKKNLPTDLIQKIENNKLTWVDYNDIFMRIETKEFKDESGTNTTSPAYIRKYFLNNIREMVSDPPCEQGLPSNVSSCPPT